MACTSYLQGFNTSCGSNLASIKKLYIGAFESATFTFNYQQVENPNYNPEDPESGSEMINVLDSDGNPIIETVATATLGV